MDPINPWLDPCEVRRLAERLMKPSAAPVTTLADAGFDKDFIGFADGVSAAPRMPDPSPEEIPAAAPPPPVVREPMVTEPAAAPPPQEAPMEPAPDVILHGSFMDRVNRFRDWMHENFHATGIFLLDREGEIIFEEGGHGKLHFLARSLAAAARRPGAPSSNVHVKVGANATLEVIPVDTPYGCLVLGAVVRHPLPPAAVAEVMSALAKVVSPHT